MLIRCHGGKPLRTETQRRYVLIDGGKDDKWFVVRRSDDPSKLRRMKKLGQLIVDLSQDRIV